MKTLQDYIESTPSEFRQEELILEATELIARVMKESGVTKSDLASRIGKSKPFISQCLSGEQNLTLRTLADLLGALGYRMQIGAVPLDGLHQKPIGRLYPIGGWSFEKSETVSGSVDCLASTDDGETDVDEDAA